MADVSRTTKIVTIASLATVLTAGGVGYAVANGPGDEPPPADDAESEAEQRVESRVTPEDTARATEVALAETGGGTVREAELDGEDGVYEVEIAVADGSEVDVTLSQDFAVLAATPEGPDDDAGGVEDGDDAGEVDDALEVDDADDAGEVEDND